MPIESPPEQSQDSHCRNTQQDTVGTVFKSPLQMQPMNHGDQKMAMTEVIHPLDQPPIHLCPYSPIPQESVPDL